MSKLWWHFEKKCQSQGGILKKNVKVTVAFSKKGVLHENGIYIIKLVKKYKVSQVSNCNLKFMWHFEKKGKKILWKNPQIADFWQISL